LAGMRERVAVYGGTLTTSRGTGSGFVVRARFPLPQQPQ
jgi:signal transduction histidine kinase